MRSTESTCDPAFAATPLTSPLENASSDLTSRSSKLTPASMYRRRTDGKIVFEKGKSIFCFGCRGGRGNSLDTLALDAIDPPEICTGSVPFGEMEGENDALLSAARFGVEAEFCWPNMGLDTVGEG